MKLTELEQISEVPMNPGAFAAGVETGHEKGVKIGFEFEVCMPESTRNVKPADAVEVSNEWYDKITKKYPKWWNEIDPTELAIYEVDIKVPIVFNGKTFKKGADFSDIYDEWTSPYVEKQVKAVFDRLGPNVKKRMVNDWNVSLNDNSYENNVYNFARSCRMSTNNDAVKNAFWKALNISGDHKQKFWIDVFGTDDFKKIANDPRLQWDGDEMLNRFDIYDDDDSYDDDDEYDNTAKVMAKALEPVFGKPTIFQMYHQAKKDTKTWYIEPDGSLEPNDGDGACEVVTPPLPVKQGIEALKSFYNIAKQLNLYTSVDNNTGLHINVSIPDKLDVLKLAVFVGDEYVIKQWGREDNDYVDSVMKSLKGEAGGGMVTYDTRKRDDVPLNPSKKPHYKELLKIATDISDNHTASVNFNGKYVSFRHAGGDYLNKQEDVLNVVGRFVRGMVIASDPTMYRKEYLAKLTKLVRGEQPANNQGHQISQILQFKTKPIEVEYLALYGCKSNSSVRKMSNECGAANDEDYVLLDPTTAKPISDELLQVTKPGYSEVKEYMKGILKYPQHRAVYAKLTSRKGRRYEDTISQGWDNIIGVYVEQSGTIQPGTPAHTILFKRMLDNAKEQMKFNLRRNR